MLYAAVRIVPIVVGTCMFGTVAISDEKPDEAVSELRTFLGECSAKSGYDPDKTGGLGEHELHPGEGDYARCAYGGINRYLKARSRIPDIYDRFISKHQELTHKVTSGAITRDERKATLEGMADTIRKQEKALEVKATDGVAKATGDAKPFPSADDLKRMEELKQMMDRQIKTRRSTRALRSF